MDFKFLFSKPNIPIDEIPLAYQLSCYFKIFNCLDLIVEFSAHCNFVEILDFLSRENFNFGRLNKDTYGNFIYPIDIAANQGSLDFIKWFDEKNYPFKYSEYAIDDACFYGNLKVLEWFHYSKHEFKYSEYAIIGAAYNGYCHILDFLHDYYEIKLSPQIIWYTIDNQKIEILQWFKNKNYILPINNEIIELALYKNNYEIINWLHDNNYFNYVTYKMLFISSLCLNFKFFLWMINNNLPIKHNTNNYEKKIITFGNYHFNNMIQGNNEFHEFVDYVKKYKKHIF